MKKVKKCKKLSIVLFSLLTIHNVYGIDVDNNKDESYPVEIKSYSLEQKSPDERVTLQDYGEDKDGNHKYGVTFVGDVGEKNAGFNLHMIDENNAPCEVVSLNNNFSPPKQERGVETLPQVSWTVTNSINKVCHPRFYSVIAEGSGFVKFENIPMPEIQINLDNIQNENKQLTITNISSKQVELVDITNAKGEKETSVGFKDPLAIDSGASQSMVLKPRALCKPARGNYKGRYSFNIVYKVDGETKTLPIGISYSCDNVLHSLKRNNLNLNNRLTEFEGYANRNATALADMSSKQDALQADLLETKKYLSSNATELSSVSNRRDALQTELLETQSYLKGNITLATRAKNSLDICGAARRTCEQKLKDMEEDN